MSSSPPPPFAPDASNAVSLAGNTVSLFFKTTGRVFLLIPAIASFLRGFLMLIVCVAIMILIYILVFYARPVVPLPCRSYEFDKVLDDRIYPAVVKDLEIFANGTQRYAPFILMQEMSVAKPMNLPASAQKNLTESADAARLLMQPKFTDEKLLRRNLYLYFTHNICIEHIKERPYSGFCPSSMSNHQEFRSDSPDAGERQWDEEKVKRFKQRVFDPVRRLRDFLPTLSERCDAFRGMTRSAWYTPEAFEYVMAVHRLRLVFTQYHDEISRSAMSRVHDKFSMSLWVLYFTPYTQDILNRKMPGVWRKWPERERMMHRLWVTGWQALGNWIVNMPCRIVNVSQESRAKKNKCNANVFRLM